MMANKQRKGTWGTGISFKDTWYTSFPLKDLVWPNFYKLPPFGRTTGWQWKLQYLENFRIPAITGSLVVDSRLRVERMRGVCSLEDGRSFYSASHLPSCSPAYSAQTSAKCVLTHPDTGSLCLPTLGPASEFIPPQHQAHCACLSQKGPCSCQSVLLPGRLFSG